MVSVDTVLNLLHEKHCRYTLYYLENQDEPAPIDDVVEAVAKMKADEPSDIDPEAYRRLEITLQHAHLPKVESVDFIAYNPDQGLVELTDKPPTFDTILTVARVLERPD